MAIEAEAHRETRETLMRDPIIRKMARDVVDELEDVGGAVAHADGTPRHEFTLRALRDYHARGGTIQTHTGGPAEAIIALLEEGQC